MPSSPTTQPVPESPYCSREQFEAIRPLLEAARHSSGRRKYDLYQHYGCVLHYLQPGATWYSLPPGSPAINTVRDQFLRWTRPAADGVTLLELLLLRTGRDTELAELYERLEAQSRRRRAAR